MQVSTKKYHLMLLALESGTIKTLEKIFTNQVHPSLAQKKIHTAQLQASIIGLQSGHAQLEDNLPDEHGPVAQGHASIKPITIAASITIGMLTVTARTAIIDAYRESQIAVYQANEIEEWTWIADGPRPCKWCLSMNGTTHPITEEFKSHLNCYCTSEPNIP